MKSATGRRRRPDALGKLTRRCCAAHEAVIEHGTPVMRGLSRMLMFELAAEIRRRMDEAAGEVETPPAQGS